MLNTNLNLSNSEVTEYFSLLNNFLETLNYRLKALGSDEFKNIEFKFDPENFSNKFILPTKVDNNTINSSDYAYAFKEHENKIYLVTSFGSFTSSTTGLKLDYFTNFVAEKLKTSFKQSSNFHYSTVSLSGLNEEIDLNDNSLHYNLVDQATSKDVLEQCKNFYNKREVSGLNLTLSKAYSDESFDTDSYSLFGSFQNIVNFNPIILIGLTVVGSASIACYFKPMNFCNPTKALQYLLSTTTISLDNVEQTLPNIIDNEIQTISPNIAKNMAIQTVSTILDIALKQASTRLVYISSQIPSTMLDISTQTVLTMEGTTTVFFDQEVFNQNEVDFSFRDIFNDVSRVEYDEALRTNLGQNNLNIDEIFQDNSDIENDNHSINDLDDDFEYDYNQNNEAPNDLKQNNQNIDEILPNDSYNSINNLSVNYEYSDKNNDSDENDPAEKSFREIDSEDGDDDFPMKDNLQRLEYHSDENSPIENIDSFYDLNNNISQDTSNLNNDSIEQESEQVFPNKLSNSLQNPSSSTDCEQSSSVELNGQDSYTSNDD